MEEKLLEAAKGHKGKRIGTKLRFRVDRKKVVEWLKITGHRLWRYFLVRLRNKTMRIRYGTEMETNRALRDLAIYLFFLYLTTVVTQTNTSKGLYYSNYLGDSRLFRYKTKLGPHFYLKYRQLRTIYGFWNFMNRTFLELLKRGDFQKDDPCYVYKSSNDATAYREVFGDVYNRTLLHGNIFLGPPRLRQIRVKEDTCKRNSILQEFLRDCYSQYTRSNTHTEGYDGDTYWSMWKAWSTMFWGEVDLYVGGGYVKSLSYDRAENQRMVKRLNETCWIDSASRLILLEYTMFHPNTNLLQSVKFILELPASGGVLPNARFRVMRRDTYFNDPSWRVRFTVIAFYFMISCRTYTELYLSKRAGYKKYFWNMLNAVDGTMCLCSYIMLLYHVWQYLYIDLYIMRIVQTTDIYVSLDWANVWYVLYLDVAAIVIFLAWIRLLHFIGFNRTMIIFVNVMRACAADLLSFLFMFITVFVAYALVGKVLFGTADHHFRSYSRAMLTIVRWILCDIDYMSLEHANPMAAPVYFMSFALAIYIILLHIFLAIINVTYDVVKHALKTRPQKLTAVAKKFLWNVFNLCYWIVTRKKRTKNPGAIEAARVEEFEVDQRIDANEAIRLAKKRADEERNRPKLHPGVFLISRATRLSSRLALLEETISNFKGRMDHIEGGYIPPEIRRKKEWR